MLPGFKTYHKATIIQTVWHKHQDGWIPTELTEGPDINPDICTITNFNKGARTIQWKKNSLFTNWYWDN